MSTEQSKKSVSTRAKAWLNRQWQYCSEGVWSDTRHNWRVNVIKTLNLSIRSFLDRDLQSRSAALTFKTLLAIVPALALFFAIGKGFGMQNGLKEELFHYFPAQSEALNKAFSFVDSYLQSSGEGVFVGIGIVFLLYTLISLLGSVEDSFNLIWGIKHGRTLGRKITDYTAILLLLPILLICSGGITVLMSSMLQTALPYKSLSPFIGWIVDFVGVLLGWLFFAGAYMLVPNTHVKFKNAMMAGILAGTAYAVVQWLFVTGQIYVTRYNAIYGSFAFLPLLLLWLQLVWLITLAGGVLCYSSQSIYDFGFSNEIARISLDYRRKILVGVLLVTIKRRVEGRRPIDERLIAVRYGLPISLVAKAVNDLVDAGLLIRVTTADDEGRPLPGVTPAIDTDVLTLGVVLRQLRFHGTHDFISHFNSRFESVVDTLNDVEEKTLAIADGIVLRDLALKLPPENQ